LHWPANQQNGTCSLSSLVLDVDGSVQGNSSRAVPPLTLHHCSIHCESSNPGASKRRWTPQAAHDTLERSTTTKCNQNEVIRVNAEYEVGQAARTVFQGFCMTQPGIEPNLPALCSANCILSR